MNVVLPICAKDADAALRNLAWCLELDSQPQPFVCYVSHETTLARAGSVIEAARRVFREVRQIHYAPATGARWPVPSSAAFRAAASAMARQHEPWLWWEQDAVPLKPGWLGALAAEYARAQRSFMGALGEKGPRAQDHLNGVAIYPADACRRAPALLAPLALPFDVRGGRAVLAQAHITRLIQHVWSFEGPMGAPAAFPDAASLARLAPEAVLFHRCKDASLVKLLALRAALAGTSDDTVGAPAPRASLIQTLMRWKYGTGKWIIGLKRPVKAAPRRPGTPRLVHCLERHRSASEDAIRRAGQAQESWITLYKSGRVIPAHVWDYSRSSAQIGDARQLPFLKDILMAGLNAGCDFDHVILTNDDTILHPAVADYLLAALETKPALSSFRINFNRDALPGLEAAPAQLLRLSQALPQRGDHDIGRDLFAFRKEWLRAHWHEIPDFLLGELEWDLVLAYLIRKDAGFHTTKFNGEDVIPECELPKGYVLHERHDRVWTSREQEASAAKLWNRRLATEFYADNQMHSLITNKL